MSFLIYQRSDPRYGDWIPLLTQQFRLRNLIQIVGVNLSADADGNDENSKDGLLYYTLHLTPMSAPFFTSERLNWSSTIFWKEVEPRQIPAYVPLSAPGVVIRIWSTNDDSKAITSWGLYFSGLHCLGRRADWKSHDFSRNTIVFRTPFGFFTDIKCITSSSIPRLERYITFQNTKCLDVPKMSYTVKNLASLHGVQRAVLEEIAFARSRKQEISQYGYSTDSDYFLNPPTVYGKALRSPTVPKQVSLYSSGTSYRSGISSGRPQNVEDERIKIQLKEAIENKRNLVRLLKDEKGRCEGRVHRIKQRTGGLDERVIDLTHRVHALGRERDRLRDFKGLLFEKKSKLAESRSMLNLRKKQLISELLVIYPIKLVSGSKKYSIAEVQLPNAEDYGNESSTQVSCALGYTAHLIAVMCFFLGIPPRYPIRHFGSKSRIVDHITTQIPDKEREFPLHFRGREDVYSKYAVWLLNKNVAQLRWYCGLSTPDLRATLPNLYNLLTSRLIIPGWPPSPADSCEMAEELTEETEQNFFKTEVSLSLDGGLDQISHKIEIDLKQQPWMRSSFSDLEFAGGNAVPEGELHHGREQNRYLSGWKKKTYSESEEIDPRWLTDSLSLDLDLGRVSNTPSPPLRIPTIVLPGDHKDILRRKRRFGRVELSNIYQSSPIESPTKSLSANNLNPVPLPENTALLTPNHSMNEVELHIYENERRKSVVETSRLSPHPPSSQSQSKRSSFLSPAQPTVDNYSTTDEEKFDDTIAEVVRKISQMDAAAQVPKIITRSQDDTIYENQEHVRGPLPSLVIEPDTTQEFSTPEILSKSGTCTTSIEEDDETELSGEHEQITRTSIPENPTIASVMLADDNHPHDFDSPVEVKIGDCVTLESQDSVLKHTQIIPEENSKSSCDTNHEESVSISNDGDISNDSINTTVSDDSSSLWFRTEALMGSQQSFNMVRRRISESN